MESKKNRVTEAILAIFPPVTLENSATGGKKKKIAWLEFFGPNSNSVAAKIA